MKKIMFAAFVLGFNVTLAHAADTSQSATAESQKCTGDLIQYYKFQDKNGRQIGQVETWYDSAKARYCTINFHGDANWGHAEPTYVDIYSQDPGVNGPDGTPKIFDHDQGNYRFQAGPVYADNANPGGKIRCLTTSAAASGAGSSSGFLYNGKDRPNGCPR